MAGIRVLIVCLTLCCTASAAAQTGIVSGTVTRSATAAPVEAVSIYLCTASYSCYTASTDTSGAYSVTAPPGTYYLYTANTQGLVNEIYDNEPCRGFCNLSTGGGTPIVVTAGSTIAGRNFSLDLGGVITGTVVNAVTAAAASGVLVYAYVVERGYADFVAFSTTDNSGAYKIDGLVTGTYFVFTSSGSELINEIYNDVQCPGQCDPSLLAVSAQPVAVTTGGTTGGINFALDVGGTVSGRVRNSAGSAPLQGVTVYIALLAGNSFYTVAWGNTDASGDYSATGLPTGTYYALTYNNLGFIDEVFGGSQCVGYCVSVAGGASIAVTAGATTTNRNFDLEFGGSIAGVVTRAGSSTPLADVPVYAYVRMPEGDPRFVNSGSTGTSGAYSIGKLPTGTYYIYTRDDGGSVNEIFDDLACVGSCQPGLAIARGTGIAVTAGAATAGKNFALDLGGTISGVIRSLAGAPIADAGVYVYTRDAMGLSAYVAQGSTNASGAYAVAGLPSGTYQMVTQAPGHQNEIYNDVPCLGYCSENAVPVAGEPIAVAIGATVAGIDFHLDAGGRISGSVKNAATSQPLANVSVMAIGRDGTGQPRRMGEALSDGLGAYTIGGLAPGEYFLMTWNYSGWQNQMHPGLNCVTECSSADLIALGTPVGVAGGTTAGRDFALNAPTGEVRGLITNSATSAPLADVAVFLYARAGARYTYAASGASDVLGRFTIGNLPAGTYYALTNSSGRFLDEIHPDIPCLTTCEFGIGAVTVGAPITVGSSAVTLDFALQPLPAALPPGQVIGLSARIANHTVVFSWRRPGIGTAGDYLLEVGVAPGTTLVSIPLAARGYTANGVPPGRYFARVRARNAAGAGPASSEYQFTVNPDGSGVPDEPVDLLAFARDGTIEVSWGAPFGGGFETGYLLEVGTASGLSNVASVPLGPRSRFTYSSPVPPGVYFVRVKARNAASLGKPSREVMLVVGDVPAPPDPPSNVGVSIDTARQALIGWVAPRGPVLGYLLEVGSARGRQDIAVLPFGASVTTVPVPNVPPGVYYLRVRSVNAQGAGLPSLDVTFIVP